MISCKVVRRRLFREEARASIGRSRGRSSPARTPILLVHHRSELGGAPASLSYLIRELDDAAVRAAHLLPAGPGGGPLPRVGRARAHRLGRRVHAHLGLDVPRPALAALPARALAAPGAPDPVQANPAPRPLRARPLQRLAADPGGLARAARGPPGRLAPALGAARGRHATGARSSSARRSGASPTRRSRSTTTSRTSSASARRSSRTRSTSSASGPAIPRPRRPRSACRSTGRSISYFGFIYPSKGFKEFIEAAARLRDEGIDASYLIVGGAVRGEEFFRTVVGRSLQLADLTRNYESEAKRLVDGARARGRRPLRALHAGHRQPLPGVRPRRRAVARARARPPGDRGRGERRPGRRVRLAHRRRRRRPGRDGRARGRLRRRRRSRRRSRTCCAIPQRRHRLGDAARTHAETNFDPSRNARRIEGIYRRLAPVRDADPDPLRPPPPAARRRSVVARAADRATSTRASSRTCSVRRARRPSSSPRSARPSTPATSRSSRTRGTRPYEGLRWLVLGREVSALPGHLRQLERLMRTHHFPLVHLNDSPLLPAARVAHRNGAKVVWHLRSALAGEGRDRRSRAIATLMERWGDAAIAIDSDVAARFPIDLPVTIVHNSVSPPRLRERQRRRAARSGCRRTAWRSGSRASSAARRAGPSSSRRPRSSSPTACPRTS